MEKVLINVSSKDGGSVKQDNFDFKSCEPLDFKCDVYITGINEDVTHNPLTDLAFDITEDGKFEYLIIPKDHQDYLSLKDKGIQLNKYGCPIIKLGEELFSVYLKQATSNLKMTINQIKDSGIKFQLKIILCLLIVLEDSHKMIRRL